MEQRYYISDKLDVFGFEVWERCSKETFEEYKELEKPCRTILIGERGAVENIENFNVKESSLREFITIL